MFSFKFLIIILVVVSAVTVLGALIYPALTRSRRANDYRAALVRGEAKKVAQRDTDVASRRKQVAESLKELENRSSKNVPLELRLEQAGLSLTKRQFIIYSCGAAFVLGLTGFFLLGPLYGLGALLVGGLGLPSWVISYLRAKRLKEFIAQFATAIEVIIRGVKSGLPLGACLQTLATQSQEPVRSEFQMIVASTAVGLTIAEAVDRMALRVPLAETSFFATVINIQQKSGGNLKEALGNLSQVLRDRITMELKVKALSSEAKSSAWIIGLLPFIISGLIYFVQPGYLEPLWTTETGKTVVSGILIWMSAGAFIMRQMVNFKP